jgi:hypothetical protein
MALLIQGVAPLIQVFDMPTSLQFYRDQIGFTVTQTSPQLSENPDDVNWAMLQLADVTVMLNTAYEPEHRQRSRSRSASAGTTTPASISAARTWTPRINFCVSKDLLSSRRRWRRTA